MKKRSLYALIVNLTLPISSLFAQEILKIDFQFKGKKTEINHLSINPSKVDDEILKNLLEKVSIESPDSMNTISAAVVFGNEVKTDNQTIAKIKTNTPELLQHLLSEIKISKPQNMENTTAAVVFGNEVHIKNEDLLNELLEKITLGKVDVMKDISAAVVFGNE